MAVVRKLLINPANKAQRYLFYSNGYIQNVGGALPVQMGEASVNSPPAPKAPLWTNIEPAMSCQILNWATPSGWTLDMWGFIWPWGGANGIAGATAPLTGGPEFLFGTGGAGFASPTYGFVIDFMMDPAGGGTGYYMAYDGQVFSVGTGVVVVQRAAVIPDTASRELHMDWTSKRYWILDNLGRVTGYNGGTHPAVVDTAGASAIYPSYIYGRGGTVIGTGGFRLYDFTAGAPKGWVIDAFGRVYRINSAPDAPGFQFTPNAKEWTDIGIIDDGTGANPLRLVGVTAQGRMFEWVVSTPPVTLVNEPIGSLVSNNKPWVGWTYQDREGEAQSFYEIRLATSAAYLAGTTNEVQSTNQTGAPTGGSVRLGFARSPAAPVAATATIANNASAATIQAALEALPNIGTGGVVCAGGPWGTAPVTVTFQAQMAGWDWPQITLYTNSFTGGASPTIAISTTTAGVGANPAAIANVWSKGANDNVTRVRDEVELVNATTYRAFVRTSDAGGKQSPWDFSHFTTSFTPLNVPTVVATPMGAIGTNLGVSATTGAGLPGTARFAIQFSDDTGTTWKNVRNGDALVPSGGGAASVIDYEPPFGAVRTYRAVTYIYDSTSDTWQQSAWSTSATATAFPTNIWMLTNPVDFTQSLIVRVQEFDPSYDTAAATFVAVNRNDPIVIVDGAPKLPSFELKLWILNKADRTELETMVASAQTLLLRNPFGENFYVRLAGAFKKTLMRASPLPSEVTSLRDAHDVSLQVQAVRRPQAGPLTGPLAEV